MDSLEIVLERAERLYTDEEKVELAERKIITIKSI